MSHSDYLSVKQKREFPIKSIPQFRLRSESGFKGTKGTKGDRLSPLLEVGAIPLAVGVGVKGDKGGQLPFSSNDTSANKSDRATPIIDFNVFLPKEYSYLFNGKIGCVLSLSMTKIYDDIEIMTEIKKLCGDYLYNKLKKQISKAINNNPLDNTNNNTDDNITMDDLKKVGKKIMVNMSKYYKIANDLKDKILEYIETALATENKDELNKEFVYIMSEIRQKKEMIELINWLKTMDIDINPLYDNIILVFKEGTEFNPTPFTDIFNKLSAIIKDKFNLFKGQYQHHQGQGGQGGQEEQQQQYQTPQQMSTQNKKTEIAERIKANLAKKREQPASFTLTETAVPGHKVYRPQNAKKQDKSTKEQEDAELNALVANIEGNNNNNKQGKISNKKQKKQ